MARKTTTIPNSKDADMPSDDLKQTRALVDPTNEVVLERWAKLEGRSYQMHCGILLRRIAHLYRTNPDKLQEIGLLASLTVSAA